MKSLNKYIEDYENDLRNVNHIVSCVKSLNESIINDWIFSVNSDIHKCLIEKCEEMLSVDISRFETSILNKARQTLLYERLGESFTTNDPLFIKYLERAFDDIQITVSGKGKSSYQLMLKVPESFDYENKKFESFLNLFNYFVLSVSKVDTDGNYFIVIQGDRPKECTELSLPFVYHITTNAVSNKIIKNGLIPKNKQQYQAYSPRIYVLSHDINDKGLINFGTTLYSECYDVSSFDVFKIDTEQFAQDRGHKLKFFGDPSANGGKAMFTLEPIPAKYISLYKSFKI